MDPTAHRWLEAARDEAAAVLAFRRLAIIDLSPLGHQPMQSANGRYVMTYNGEIYNYPELRRDLEAEGAVQGQGGRVLGVAGVVHPPGSRLGRPVQAHLRERPAHPLPPRPRRDPQAHQVVAGHHPAGPAGPGQHPGVDEDQAGVAHHAVVLGHPHLVAPAHQASADPIHQGPRSQVAALRLDGGDGEGVVGGGAAQRHGQRGPATGAGIVGGEPSHVPCYPAPRERSARRRIGVHRPARDRPKGPRAIAQVRVRRGGRRYQNYRCN